MAVVEFLQDGGPEEPTEGPFRLVRDADLVVVLGRRHVFRDVDLPSQVVIYESLGDFKEAHDEQREIPSAVLNVVDRLSGRDIEAEVCIERSEDPAARIVSFAVENDVDNIFIGGRGSSPVGKALFGSVAQQVLLRTDIPVTVATTPK